jgi:DNA (cytosine-5)-methyltransferase 1
MEAIDLFAGLGGFTEGAERAGVRVLWAANHWKAAVTWHAMNHGRTAHACQDLHQAAWVEVPRHDLLLGSPACTGHAWALGADRPHHDRDRSTAWAIVACAEFHRPEFIVVENVPEFRRWVLYPAWKSALQALGYAVQELVRDAADHGVPQNRRRLFVVANRAIAPIPLRLPERPAVAAAQLIDWDAGSWSPVIRPGRSLRTIERVRRGRAQHGDRFLVPFYGSSRGGRAISRPIGTITTRDRWAVVDGDRMRMLRVSEATIAMGFPGSYRLPENPKLAMHLLGNAVCPPVVTDILTAIQAAA